MPVQSRVAAAMIAFGVVGFGISVFSPVHTAKAKSTETFAFAISSGVGLRLSGIADGIDVRDAEMACDRVFTIAGVDVGTRCVRQRDAVASSF